MVDGVEGGTEVQHSEQCDSTCKRVCIGCVENVRDDLEQRSLHCMSTPVG